MKFPKEIIDLIIGKKMDTNLEVKGWAPYHVLFLPTLLTPFFKPLPRSKPKSTESINGYNINRMNWKGEIFLGFHWSDKGRV